jgi:histone H2B
MARVASELCEYSGRQTLSGREMMFATRLRLPGLLGSHAMSEGAKAMQSYIQSIDQSKRLKAARKATQQH